MSSTDLSDLEMKAILASVVAEIMKASITPDTIAPWDLPQSCVLWRIIVTNNVLRATTISPATFWNIESDS